MSKTEINECMEINAAAIKDGKQQIKNLEKAATILEAYAKEFGTMNEAFKEITVAIEFQKERIATSEALQKKRKKQMKLLEQLEALENE